MKKTLEERFWEKVNKNGPTAPHMDTPCWIWTAAKKSGEYGMFRVTKVKIKTAHRVSFELSNPLIFTGNLHVCHKCDRPSCVNPNHLFLDTNEGNHKDKIAKGRGKKTGGARKLTKDEVLSIRELYAQGSLKQEGLAKKFNTTPQNIYSIIEKITWKHI